MRISIFPLPGAILFPGMQLPLHIFEPRYRAMVQDTLARDRRIGMIQPQRAEEGAPLFQIGCLGKIVEVEALDDGRFNLVLEGEARFRVLRELDARVDAMGVEPNGVNINEGVGSTHPEALAARVRESGAELGIAFDGDGDRVLFVDGQGRVCDGDDLLYVLACDWQESGRLRGPVVGTLMTNFGFERALAARGIAFVRAKVGDRYVHQQLLAHDGVLGGEASGHILCLDRASTGDGIVSALQVLEVLQRRGIGLADALQGLRKVPQKTVNVRYGGAARPADADNVHIALAEAQRAVEGRGRAFLRASGTEPVVRVTVEADDAALVESTLEALAAAVRAAAA